MFGLRTQLIYDADVLTTDQKWRVATILFEQDGSLAFGAVAYAVTVAGLGWWRHWPALLGLAALNVVVLALRLALHRRFPLRNRADGTAHTPELWVRRQMVGAYAAAALWGAAAMVTTLGRTDHDVPLFLFMVQAGWLAGAAGRGAVSPATVAGQAVLTLIPSALGCLCSGDQFLMCCSPFIMVQFLGTYAISGFATANLGAMMRSERALEAANAQLRELTTTDPLTGINNRRGFDAQLTVEWGRAAREGTELAFLAIDVDHFKAFNDRYGHPAGDACLRLIANVVNDGLRRPPDHVARIGGEEFMAILPGTDLRGALEVADRLRRAVEAASLPHEASAFRRVTISLGVHAVYPRPGVEPQPHMDLADQALYAAKQAGRNQARAAGGVTIASLPPTPEAARAAARTGAGQV